MKQKSLHFLFFALCMTIVVTAWSQDTDNSSDNYSNVITVSQQGPIYGSPLDSYYYSWYPVSAFPATSATLYHHASAIIDNDLYVAASQGVPTAEVYKYSLGSGNGGGTWSTATSLPVSIVGGDMIACNGKLYYLGGDLAAVNGTGVSSVYEYDPSTTQWTTKANMPVALTAHGAVNWGDSVIFVMGGPWTTTGSNRNVYYYRVASNTWGTITNSLPAGSGRRTFGIGISGNKIIIAGGYAGAFLKTAYVGTINSASSITWVAVPDIPTSYGGLSRMGGEAAGGYFFSVGGERMGGGYHDTTYVFRFSSNTWLPVYAPKPTAVSNVFNAVAAKTYTNDTIRLFCPSGFVGTGINNQSFEVMKFRASVNVGVEYITDKNSIEFYPNPVQQQATLDISKTVNSSLAEILDIRGSLLKQFTVHSGANHLDLSDLPDGLYVVRVQTSNGIMTQKFNILH